jgi:Skp family chaperone for outer membrane proteins
MQTKRALWAVVVGSSVSTLAAVALTGCNKDDHAMTPGGSTTPAAVVDVDKVARDLGWMTKMEANLKAYQGQLQDDVKKAADTYNQQINNIAQSMKPRDLGPNDKYQLNPAQSQEVTQYLMVERQTIQALAQKADQAFGLYRAKWVKQYRDSLAPVVRQVAQDKKISIVVQQGDTVLFADRAVDITDAVVDAAKSKPPALTEIEMEHLGFPPKLEIEKTAQQATTQSSTTQPTSTP